MWIFLIIGMTWAEVVEDDGVFVLDDSNYTEAAQTFGNILLEAYDPENQMCIEFQPVFARLARMSTTSVTFAKINVRTNAIIPSSLNIQDLPGIFLITSEEVHTYSGELTEEGLQNWLDKQFEPPLARIPSANLLDNAIASSQIVGIFFAQEDSEYLTIIDMASHSFSRIKFILCSDP